MDAFFLHILKSSGLLLTFLLVYYVFLKRETFFTGNRMFLIGGILTSILLPFISLTKTIYVEVAPISRNEVTQIKAAISDVEIVKTFDWANILLAFYLIGVAFFTCRLVLQLRSIRKIKNTGVVLKKDSFYHVRTQKQISPFSFFKHIFYNPNQYSEKDLKTILTHEMVHAKDLHSFDILLTELICILQWFNPAVWLYKAVVKQNLEFLADSKTCFKNEDKRNYQYLMLRQAIGNHKITIVNPFFNSIIKKRIVMLNQNQSKRINILKLFSVLPLLVLFLVGFNTKEVVKFSSASGFVKTQDEDGLVFQSPLKQADIVRISSVFGLAKNPFSNTMENHTGIDIVAKAGRDVLASAEGIVTISEKTTVNGNYIVIEHEDGYRTRYLHLKDRSVKVGDKVKVGKTIGHVGNTGKSTGTHLHFEILKSGKAINPESLVPFKTNQKSIESDDKSLKKIELTIEKNTTDEELEKIKRDLSKEDIDFSFTVVHNEKKEIIAITLQISGKGKNGETFNSAYNSSVNNEAISPLLILIDADHNLISIGSKGEHHSNEVHIDSEDGHIWISSDAEKHKEIRIKEENGKKVIIVDGVKVSEEDIDDMDIHMENSSNVFIHSDSDDEHDVRIISEKRNGFFFIDTEGEKNPLFIVDGKESSSKKVKRLNPDNIQTIDVSKGDEAIKKYGKKAKDGVVEIITKKN